MENRAQTPPDKDNNHSESARSTETGSTVTSLRSLAELDKDWNGESPTDSSRRPKMTKIKSSRMPSGETIVSDGYCIATPKKTSIAGLGNLCRDDRANNTKLTNTILAPSNIGSAFKEQEDQISRLVPTIPGGMDKWQMTDMGGIDPPDKWGNDQFWECKRRKAATVERSEPRPAFIPSTTVFSRGLLTVLWVLIGAGFGFLLGTLTSIITVQVTSDVPNLPLTIPVQSFCEITESGGTTYAKQRVDGVPFPNTFVTLKTKASTVALQVLGLSIFDSDEKTCHVEIQTINSVLEVLRKTRTIVYTRYDGTRETLAWDEV